MTIKVYVAGSARAKERARSFMDRIRAHDGMTVALDWVAPIDANDARGVVDSDLSDEDRVRYARADLDAVASCDVLVVLAEETPTGRGMWIELGYALALRTSADTLGPAVIVVSGGEKRSIFTSPGLVTFEFCRTSDDDFEAWEALRRMTS